MNPAWRAQVRVELGDFALHVKIDGPSGPLALVGPNGSGKTTLLRALAGVVPVQTAQVVVGGRPLASTDQGLNLPPERRRVGYVPQRYALFPHLDVLDNIAFGLSVGPRATAREARRDRARQLLVELDAAPLADRPTAGLSGGEQQRIALARALIVEPQLLLLDEPLAALDATTRRRVRGFLTERLRSLDCPSVLVTHDARDVAALDAPVLVLEQGHEVQRGSLEELRNGPNSDFVAEFCAV